MIIIAQMNRLVDIDVNQDMSEFLFTMSVATTITEVLLTIITVCIDSDSIGMRDYHPRELKISLLILFMIFLACTVTGITTAFIMNKEET